MKKQTQSEARRKDLVKRLYKVYLDLKKRGTEDTMSLVAKDVGTTRETLSRWFNWHVLPMAHVPAIERYLERMDA